MSLPWLKEDYKKNADPPRSRSRSRSGSKSGRPKVDEFGRSVPGRKSKSRSKSGSPDRNKRSRPNNSGGFRGRGGYGGDNRGRSRSPSRAEGKRRRRRSSSSSNSSRGSRGSPVRPVASDSKKYVNARVFVANITSKDVTKDELIRHFEKYGNVVDLLIHPKNYAFIQYLKEDHAQLAVEGENGSTFKGMRIDVKMAYENRRGAGGRGGRGGGRGGMGRGGHDMMPHDGPMRDPYGPDPFLHHGPGRMPYPPPHPGADFGMRDPYYPPDPYRRGYPDPWLPPPPEDPYRREPYGDPYRDSYPVRPQPPQPTECEIFLVNHQLRTYGESIERRIKNQSIITAMSVIPEGRTAPQMIEDLTTRGGLYAIFINAQNEIHRSLTLNILHGTPQEHRNMPLDDAIEFIGRNFDKYVEALRAKNNASSSTSASAPTPTPASTPTRVFLPPSSEVTYLLNLLADNRALTIPELDSVIKYLKERRDKMADVESRPVVKDGETTPHAPPQAPPPAPAPVQETQKSKELAQEELTKKILSIFNAAESGTGVRGVPPANTSMPSQPVMSGAPAPAPPPPPPSSTASANLINFDNPNVQKALDNLIQNSPSLLKNIAPKLSSAPQTSATSSGSSSNSNNNAMNMLQGYAQGIMSEATSHSMHYPQGHHTQSHMMQAHMMQGGYPMTPMGGPGYGPMPGHPSGPPPPQQPPGY